MKYVTDVTFAAFLDVVDRFEGPRIRAVSSAAASALPLFMYNGTAQSELWIELIDQDALERVPRLSQMMEALFTVKDGIGTSD